VFGISAIQTVGARVPPPKRGIPDIVGHDDGIEPQAACFGGAPRPSRRASQRSWPPVSRRTPRCWRRRAFGGRCGCSRQSDRGAMPSPPKCCRWGSRRPAIPNARPNDTTPSQLFSSRRLGSRLTRTSIPVLCVTVRNGFVKMHWKARNQTDYATHAGRSRHPAADA
jgi:hypothetical protein